MKNRIRVGATLIWALVSNGMLSTPAALAGGESSVGGADSHEVVPAFFRSYDRDAAVNGCFEVARDFGIDSDRARMLVEGSFKTWASYMVEKRLNIVPAAYFILTRLELHTPCVGTEDLRVFFGVENDEIIQHKGHYERPYAFADYTPPPANEFGSHGRGLVWFAPPNGVNAQQLLPTWNSQTRDALAGLVLHEMGHVFGNGHVDGTVMTPRIGEYLADDASPYSTRRRVDEYAKIDSRIELVPCLECRASYVGEETYDPIRLPGAPLTSDWALTFKRVVGRDPVGPLVFRFERLGSPSGTGTLRMMDSIESYAFDLVAETEIAERKDSTPLFTGHGGVNFYSFGVSYYSHLRTQDGTSIPVAVNYNMNMRKVQILPLGSGFYPRPVFVSAP